MIDSELQQLLRIFPEPYVFHDDQAVHQALTARPRDFLDHLHDGLCAIAHGRATLDLPPKAVFIDPDKRSDFRVMPCVIRYPDRVRKTVKIVGTNWPRQIVPGEISVGQAFALQAEENFIEAGFGACILSSARTGACAATAMRLLAPGANRVAIVGAGRVGYFAGLYAAALGAAGPIAFCDLDEKRAALAGQLIARDYPDIQPATFEISALRSGTSDPLQPEVLILATDSEQPLFDASGHQPQLVISVGADTDWQREIHPDVLKHYPVVVDAPDSILWGDLKRFQASGLMAGQSIPDFNTLISQPQTRPKRALVVSTGSALLDNLTIDYLLGGGMPG